MAFPVLESVVVVPTEGWTATVSGDHAGTISIPAGTYSLDELMAALEADLEAITESSCTIFADGADTGIIFGLVDIEIDSGFHSITWVSTDFRDALGFDTDLAEDSHWGADGPPGFLDWQPGVGRTNALSPDGEAGVPIAETATAVSPTGHARTLHWAERYEDNLEFHCLLGSRVWTSLGNSTSLEVFWTQVAGLGSPFRYYPDGDNTTTFATYVAVPEQQGSARMPVDAMFESWTSTSATLWTFGTRVIKHVEG